MKTAIVNLDTIVTGDWREPLADGDSILMEDGLIEEVGTVEASKIDGDRGGAADAATASAAGDSTATGSDGDD